MKKLSALLILLFGYQLLEAQNVGIGTSTPSYKLDVIGSIHSTSNGFFDNAVGIGTTFPSYKLQVNDGSIAISNTADAKTWYFSYTSAGYYLFLSESGTSRMVFANGGNVGIGTSTPTTKLDVNGGLHINGSVDVEANLTVSGGMGIMRNS